MGLFNSTYLSYRETGAFTPIILDYLDGATAMRPFYTHSADEEGIRNAMASRDKFATNRELLVTELGKQYVNVKASAQTLDNIESLRSPNTYTICTAHQPNIFTGHLYFVYKIVHAIQLANHLNQKIKGSRFVPVYYMGSEDADLEELGEVKINQAHYEWKTNQKGAVGRMIVDDAFLDITAAIEGQLAVEPFGNEIVAIIKNAYTKGKTIEQATFELVNELFGKYGLVVLLPDNAALKKAFEEVCRKELEEQFSHALVKETIAAFPEHYKIQAAGRELNLFYLKDDTRERIEPTAKGYGVANTSLSFTKDEMYRELSAHPERFSPNVILRPVFQELVLPNIVFIGGGGEVAYWLELKKVFESVGVPFPVLALRNSFLLINKHNDAILKKLRLSLTDIFKPLRSLQDALVNRESMLQLTLTKEKNQLSEAYDNIINPATAIDNSLQKHVLALQANALHRIGELEKKMLKAEKKKHDASLRQIEKLKRSLFPNNSLQERVDNLLPFYAKWGAGFVEEVLRCSKPLTDGFCVMSEE